MLFRKSFFVVSLVFTANSWASPAIFHNDINSNSNSLLSEHPDMMNDSLLTAQDVNENEQVCQEESPFFIPHHETNKENAAVVCSQYGGDLAPISNQNFVDATALLFNCRGPMSHAWIRSWDATDYSSNCLTLYTGSSIPGGGIDINCIGDDRIVPICVQKRDKQPSSLPPTTTSTKLSLASSGFSIATSTSTLSMSRPPFTVLEPIPNDTISFTSSPSSALL
ncbi:hypothetical protein BD408DRAFT_65341 [Parasitella parasitica]|nr:hypothetical protein BD408DRAFT_65341 [Parasitella parasitica]